MSWWEIVKDLAPPLREALDTLRTSRRRKRHLFVLKAMGRPERRSAVITASMSLDEICEKLMMAQIEDAIPAETRARAFLNGQSTPEEDKDAKKKFAAQRRVGIPDIHDPNRAGKVEHILQDMVEAGKLRFYPPDRYSIE